MSVMAWLARSTTDRVRLKIVFFSDTDFDVMNCA